MANINYNSQDFEEYLANLMDPEEKSRFEDGLNKDPELQGRFNRYKQLNALVNHVAMDHEQENRDREFSRIKDEIEEIFKTEPGESRLDKFFRSIGRFFENLSLIQKIAIPSLIVILILAALFIPTDSSCDPESVYNNYSSEIDKIPFRREMAARPDQTEDLKWNAAAAFEQNNYADAIEIINQYLANTTDSKALLFLGQCHLKAGNTDKAIEELDKIENGMGEYEQAIWIKMLANLKMESFDEAQKLLDFLIENESIYATQAQEIQKQLPCLLKTKSSEAQ